ncbi:MAG: DUF192 domain-containing protein [Candidatus ainarchaeum sp.]|nr:DUF192 domain-containing protein [Candidatus ainarchaeum sp.]
MLKINGKNTKLQVRFANDPWQRLKGLMFEDEKNFNYALLFENPSESKINSAVHMIFVFFPIDIIFLNKTKKVVDKITLLPFTPNYTPKKPAQYFIEMPKGKASKIKIGDKIEW